MYGGESTITRVRESKEHVGAVPSSKGNNERKGF